MDPLRPKRPRLKLDAEAYKRLHKQVLDRDAWRCQTCGSASNLHVHHLKSRNKLGDDVLDNLVTLCCVCHARRHWM